MATFREPLRDPASERAAIRKQALIITHTYFRDLVMNTKYATQLLSVSVCRLSPTYFS